MMCATLESTTDAIVIIDEHDHVTGHDERFVKLWRVPAEIMKSGDAARLREGAAPGLPAEYNEVRPWSVLLDAGSFPVPGHCSERWRCIIPTRTNQVRTIGN